VSAHQIAPPVTPVDVTWLRQDLNQFRLDLLADIQVWERRGLLREASHAREVHNRVVALMQRLANEE